MPAPTPPPSPAAPKTPPRFADTLPPYDPYAPMPQPDVAEKDSDTAWQMFQEVKDHETKRFADTAPYTVPGPRSEVPSRDSQSPGSPLRPAASSGTSGIEKLIDETRRNNRVCPQPPKWLELDALLRGSAPKAAGSLPPPLAQREWNTTTSLAKRLMFRSVVDWAVTNGQVEAALNFVRALPEEQWHHMGD